MSHIQTVCGPIAPDELGWTLIHEHILVDFLEDGQPSTWDRDAVAERMRPFLQALLEQGITAFADCTPNYLARDPRLLRCLSEETGLHILTNTGLYKEPALPPYAFSSSAEELAERWIAEWEDGIDGSDVRPGFIKIAVNPGPLVPIQRKIVRAAALTHRETSLLVASHTANAVAAQESLDIVEEVGMSPTRYVIVHADQIGSWADREALFERGAWLEYDSIGTVPWSGHAKMVQETVEAGYVNQLLLSQDAGWYTVGEHNGGSVRPYTGLMTEFVPCLREAGVSEETLRRLLVDNPARALAVE